MHMYARVKTYNIVADTFFFFLDDCCTVERETMAANLSPKKRCRQITCPWRHVVVSILCSCKFHLTHGRALPNLHMKNQPILERTKVFCLTQRCGTAPPPTPSVPQQKQHLGTPKSVRSRTYQRRKGGMKGQRGLPPTGWLAAPKNKRRARLARF